MRKSRKNVIAGLLTVALAIPFLANGNGAKAEETQISFAKNADGTEHENSFELARESEDKDLSSYEADNGKHWVKLFSKFDGVKNIFNEEDIPDGTAKMKVVFDITNYDLDQAYPLTWATGIGGGWTAGKPTGVTIDQSGTYEAVLDFESATDGIGQTITSADINAASLQLVFQLGESGQENIANVKKTKVTFKACYAYETGDEVTAATVAPVEETKAPEAEVTKAPESTNTPGASVVPSASPNATVTPVVSSSPSSAGDDSATSDTTANKVKKLKAAKAKVTIKKGKKKTITFQITTAVKNTKTTDQIKKASVSNKKIAKVLKKSLSKKKCTVSVKGLKKGKTTLTVKVGSKTAKVKIIVA